MFSYFAAVGWVMIGWILPELAVLAGNGKASAPVGLNILAAIAFGLISSYYFLG